TRPTLVHQRGDAGAHTNQIGVQTEAAGDVLVDVCVRVDHSGCDDLACDIQYLTCGIDWDHRFDCSNAVIANTDIGDTVAPGPRIDHPPSAQRHVELCVHRFLHQTLPAAP